MNQIALAEEGAKNSTSNDSTTTPSKKDPVLAEAEIILQEMKVTKGSRFNAAERLRKKDRSNTIATTYLSIVVICIAIAGLAYPFPQWLQSATNLATIILSIFIVVFSLLQYSSGDAVKAELHHRCATEINGLRRRLRASIALGNPLVEQVSSEYDAVLQKYGSNHEPVDFETYKLEHPNEYPPRSEPTKQALQREEKLQGDFAQTVIGIVTRFLIFSAVLAAAVGISRNIGRFEEVLRILLNRS